MGKERDEALCVISKPLRVSEKKVDDHHRCANEMVVEFALKQAHPCQGFEKKAHFVAPLFNDVVLKTIRGLPIGTRRYSIFTSGAHRATAPNAAFPQEPGSPAS